LNFIVIIAVLSVVLFVISYGFKSRLGILALALSAGTLLSQFATRDITQFLEYNGIELASPPMESVVSAVLIVVPSFLLLRAGARYHKRLPRIVGSVLFALLAICLLLDSLQAGLVIEGNGKVVYNLIMTYKAFAICGVIIYALLDLILIKKPSAAKADAKH